MRAAAILAVAAGFAIGAAFHAADFLRDGWWPYRFGPAPLNLFWNALLPLDLLVVALLLWRPRIGLPFAALVIIADVAVNAYAWRWLAFDAFAGAVPVQAAFAIVVLAVLARDRRRGTPDHPR